MSGPALSPDEIDRIRSVFQRHAEVKTVKLFGSRAKGTHRPQSDVDLALWGDVDELGAQAIAAELDELPLPYRYDVVTFTSIRLQALRDHIERVGIQIFPS
jgi:predicted nucleotidyltransferase